MGMETLPEPSTHPKSRISEIRLVRYVDRLDSEFFVSNFWFLGFGRVLLTPKHEAIIVKEKSNLYLEGYNGTSDIVLLSSRGYEGTDLFHFCSI